MKIAFFGSKARFSLCALEELAAHHEVVAIVMAEPAYPPWRHLITPLTRLRRGSALEQSARRLQIPLLRIARAAPSVADRLRAYKPDLICVALFPKLLPQSITNIAPLGAINVHPSLLPRHRGPLPLFWTYHCDDRVAGATVHHASPRFDGGDIILQESLELPRAYPQERLDADISLRAALLLGKAAEALAHDHAPRRVQDEGAATWAPLIRAGNPMVRFDEWDVERVRHFLGGLAPRYREPLIDDKGRAVPYDRVVGYETVTTRETPGTVQAAPRGWTLHCRNGVVHLAAGRS